MANYGQEMATLSNLLGYQDSFPSNALISVTVSYFVLFFFQQVSGEGTVCYDILNSNFNRLVFSP